ncbi:MAG: hypothetical protein WCJ18_01585 [Planctomycetota bacterium]
MWWATLPEAMAAQVFVLYPNGQRIGPLEVELSDSIDTIKQLVQDRLGAPPDHHWRQVNRRPG